MGNTSIFPAYVNLIVFRLAYCETIVSHQDQVDLHNETVYYMEGLWSHKIPVIFIRHTIEEKSSFTLDLKDY